MRMKNQSKLAEQYLLHDEIFIIDMHGHLGNIWEFYLPSSKIQTMVRRLKQAKVSRIVTSSHNALLIDELEGNLQMQEAINTYPDTFLGYWVYNPNSEHLQGFSDFEKSNGFVGFKLLPDYHTVALDNELYAPVLEYAHENKYLVLVHTWGGSKYDSPQQVLTVAQRYPQCIFIMAHSGFGDWKTSVEVAKQTDNVVLDITSCYVAHDFSIFPHGSGTPEPFGSCLQVNGIIEYFVSMVGAEKVVFGSDNPWFDPRFVTGSILFSHISDNEKEKILYKNALNLLEDKIQIYG